MMRLLCFVFCLAVTACGPNSSGVGTMPDRGQSSPRFDAGMTGSICGNGTIEDGEQCDDGNRFNDDACSNTCESSNCGDGEVNPGEEDCDDGNRIDTDGCRNDCSPARCGDGVARTDIAPGQRGHESCDDGNAVDDDACLASCQSARCGDGIRRTDLTIDELGYEACDDGNAVETDECLSNCQMPSCGDGEIGPGEACDDGNQINEDSCLNNCALASCGDGITRTDLQPSEPGSESCDDGNAINEDACTSSCLDARCGDGITRQDIAQGQPDHEGCDDGNRIDADDCSNTCQAPACGNGQIEAGESCDDGNRVDTDGCRNTCILGRCGDGVVRTDLVDGQNGFESCDDGNRVDSDGCLNRCLVARCGDGVRRTDRNPDQEGYEVCDDGNQDPADACDRCFTTCARHANCPGDYGRCRVPAGAQRGTCHDLRNHACAAESDCDFTDANEEETFVTCQANRCKVNEFNTCLAQVDCIENTRCQTVGDGRSCVQSCTQNTDCQTAFASCQTVSNQRLCWYTLCGNPAELSPAFATVDNGRLGGSCANDIDNPEDGHCYEVSGGVNEWVGLCFEGGTLRQGSTCSWGVARANNAQQCGGGLLCTGHDQAGDLHCRATCSRPGSHGRVTCSGDTTCMAALDGEYYVYACIPRAEQCDVVARSSCGANGRCATLLTTQRTSHCTALAAVNDRVGAGEACTGNSECPDGYFCGAGQVCTRTCANDNDCDGNDRCNLAQGSVVGICETR